MLQRTRNIIYIVVTSHAFTPPPSEFVRDVVIISHHGKSFGLIVILGAWLGVASERISHDWVNGSSSERVGVRHDFGFQFEFRLFRQVQSITNSEFGVRYFGSIQFRRRGVEHSSFVICGARTSTMESYFSRTRSVGVFRTESFSRSRSGVVIEMDMLDVIRASLRRRMTKWWWWCFGFNVDLHD